MPEDSIQPKADEQQAAAEQKQRDQSGPNVVAPQQSLTESPEEVKNPAPADRASAKHDGRKTPLPANWPPHWYLAIDLCVAAAIAYFAYGQVKFGELQWDATNKQYKAMIESNKITKQAADAATESNRIAAETAKKQLRACMGVDTTTIEWNPKDNVATLSFHVKNYGQTPAYWVASNVNFAYLAPPFNQQPRLQECNTPHSEFTLAPSTFAGPGNVTIHKAKTLVTAAEKKRIDSHKTQLVITGFIEYDDLFDKDRVIVFQMRWDGKELIWDSQDDMGEQPELDAGPVRATANRLNPKPAPPAFRK